ncbi:hypothetical protein [Neobacillus kokaensis]|uniref:Uncharacterized protein n=1 Tax=Neobacillus kokaensis TaxID=2759023 RepID=A0ABQ3N9U0_9BACI|nr:hypothetical protein [Neobacillus kokaensis]GHH98336.1 hypothetical protein AM1BK_18790 [Neobacillus kokaensis]
MKINDYYRDAAHLNLNSSIAALFLISILVAVNLSFFQNEIIFTLTIPFFLYSFFCFQLYLLRKRQAMTINRNMGARWIKEKEQSFFSASHLLVLYDQTQGPSLHFYYPDGHLAGNIKKYHPKGVRKLNLTKFYILYNSNNKAIACFRVKGKKIEVFDKERIYLGCLKKTKLKWLKCTRELFDSKGNCIGSVVGSSIFMDEKLVDQENMQVLRLRRGWMPVEWSLLFPEPNTPVLSFSGKLSVQDKLLRMSFLINEYFMER